ncbi:MAG: HAD family phosphatase, partial [Oscillospiraceae bacterium]|nr:HAD family phosphatase [Oscillospiraceae bacterium]
MRGINNIRGAIFDLDGTLLDSMPIYESIDADLLKTIGKTAKPGIYDAIRPLSGMQVPEYLRAEYALEQSAEWIMARLDTLLYDFYARTAPVKPGAARTLEALARQGVRMCVATATNRELVEISLKRTGLDKYFERIFTCAEEGAGKDEPTIFLKAAGFLGTELAETVVFEDSLHAILSAKRGGFPVVAVFDKSSERHRAEIERLAD